MTTPSDIATYLAAIPQVTSTAPCTVTIKGKTVSACRYVETLRHSPGTPAYARGEREYTREMIYCVGPLPRCTINRNVTFILEGDAREWYVAGYWTGIDDGRTIQPVDVAKYHPFGAMFLLCPWDIAGSKVDDHARVPYRRVAMTLA